MSDADGDSTMHSSPSDVEDMEETGPQLHLIQEEPATPTGGPAPQHPHAFVAPSSEISPPNSQHGPATHNAFASTSRNEGLPEGSPSTNSLNINGKRAIVEGRSEPLPKGNKPIGKANSGYEWSRPEDEPGWSWLNRKAQDEYYRAMEQIVDKDYMIKSTAMYAKGDNREEPHSSTGYEQIDKDISGGLYQAHTVVTDS